MNTHTIGGTKVREIQGNILHTYSSMYQILQVLEHALAFVFYVPVK